MCVIYMRKFNYFLQNFQSVIEWKKENSKINLIMSNILRANRRKQRELEKKAKQNDCGYQANLL